MIVVYARRMRIDNYPADAPMCASGKRPFRDAASAQANLDRAREYRGVDIARGRRPGRVERGYYQCPACKWWHLTSTTSAQRRGALSEAKSNRRRRG